MVHAMDDQENQGIDHRLAQAIGENADAVAIAEAVASLWLEFEAALRPIVGPAAVTALYRRSLNLASATTPGFNRVSTSSAEGSDVDGLREYLTQCSASDALTSGSSFLRTFHELLASLIGPSLAQRLLCPVPMDPLSDLPPQDVPP